MSNLKLPEDTKKNIIKSLKDYLDEHFELRPGQFELEFLFDFIVENVAPAFYNRGIDEAIKTHSEFSERIQEEIDLKRIL